METYDHSRSPQEVHEVFALVWALHNDALTPEQAVRLEELVCGSDAAQQIYVELIGLFAGLRWNLSECKELSRTGPFPALPSESNASVTVHSATPIARSLRGRIRLSSRLVGFVASLLLIGYFVGLTGLVMWDYS